MQKKYLSWILVLIFVVPLFMVMFRRNRVSYDEDRVEIVSSCFPTYNMAVKLLSGLDGFRVSNLTSNYLSDHSCLHDYNLTSENARAIEDASVLIVNGVDFEPFISKISSENLQIIDSSKNVKVNNDKNPYIWISIENYLNQLKFVSDELCKIFVDYKNQISDNLESYVNVLENLKKDWTPKFSKFKGKKVAVFSEKFDYFLRELGLVPFHLVSEHSHEDMTSADKISNAVTKIKENHFKFFISDNANKTCSAIEKESGVKLVLLNNISDSKKGSYVDQMRYNFEKLHSSLSE